MFCLIIANLIIDTRAGASRALLAANISQTTQKIVANTYYTSPGFGYSFGVTKNDYVRVVAYTPGVAEVIIVYIGGDRSRTLRIEYSAVAARPDIVVFRPTFSQRAVGTGVVTIDAGGYVENARLVWDTVR
jgi:hypothetical protein